MRVVISGFASMLNAVSVDSIARSVVARSVRP